MGESRYIELVKSSNGETTSGILSEADDGSAPNDMFRPPVDWQAQPHPCGHTRMSSDMADFQPVRHD